MKNSPFLLAFRAPIAALSILTALGPLAGCGADNAPVKEDPAVTAKRMDAAKGMRALFDKAGGNYDTLSTEDKAAMDKLTGSESNSRTAFSHMGPSAPGGAAGGLPPSGG